MTKIIKKINNKACPAKRERSGGFVLLFAVTLSAILLSIALGVGNIALKELKFSTSAKDTNDAFFAADTGIECAEYYDKSTGNIFKDGGGTNIQCIGNPNSAVVRGFAGDSSAPFWSFTLYGLNYSGQGCAIVTVDKTFLVDPNHYVITSDGYNNGGNNNCTPTSNTVQREIQSTY